MAEGSASQRESPPRFASLTREVPHQERAGRHPRVCVYFFIKDSRRQGGGDVCGRPSAKRGRQSSCHHVKELTDCQKGAPRAYSRSRKSWKGQPRPWGHQSSWTRPSGF